MAGRASVPEGEAGLTYSVTAKNALFVGLDEYVNLHRVNQAWLDGYNASHGTQLKFSDVKPDIAGGFILTRGKISVNCSWDMLVRVAQEKQESDVVKRLFPAAE